MGAGSAVCTCGGAGSGGPAAFLGGAGRLASVGNLQGVGGSYLVSLAEAVPVPVGPSPLGAISSSPPQPDGPASPAHCPRPPRPIFHTLRHFPELAMPATLPAFTPAGPWACKTPPPPLHLDTHSSTRSQLPSRKSAQLPPRGCTAHLLPQPWKDPRAAGTTLYHTYLQAVSPIRPNSLTPRRPHAWPRAYT